MKLFTGFVAINRNVAELTAKIFRDVFGGSWKGRISKDGEFQREVVFNWPELSGKFSSLGTESGLMVPPGGGILDNTRQVAISGVIFTPAAAPSRKIISAVAQALGSIQLTWPKFRDAA